MPNPVAIERTLWHTRRGTKRARRLDRSVYTYCPGCQAAHPFRVEVYDQQARRGDGTEYPTWDWDGNLEQPTFSPSLLCHSSVHLCTHTYSVCPTEAGGECDLEGHLIGYVLPDGTAIAPKVYDPVPDGAVKARVHASPHDDPAWGNCHSFLRAGRWEFLSDSAHHLAGQTVDMVPLPGWLVDE